jgi:hypothetical protein
MRFFFDTFDNGAMIPDHLGLEVTSREMARRTAIETLPYMALDGLPDGDAHEFAVHVRDGGGRTVFKASLLFRSGWTGEGD